MSNLISYNFMSRQLTIDKYYLGIFFKEYVMQKEYFPYQFDGWNNQINYGIIDKNNNAIYPKTVYLKQYRNRMGEIHQNLNFVTDAFLEFKQFQDTFVKRNKIDPASIYSLLNVRQSTDDASNLYIDYLNKIYGIFKSSYLTNEVVNRIHDISTFILEFIKFIKIILKVTVFNRSSFIKSKNVPKSINGLRISIDNASPYLDTIIKTSKYIEDPQFEIFLQNASKFGFFVDKNFPWTLVADLDSPAMKKYMNNYEMKTVDDVFKAAYHKAYSVDVQNLRNTIITFWNSFCVQVGNSLTQKEVTDCRKKLIEVNELHQMSVESFEKHFNINWQLRLYAYIRILEERLDVTQARFEIIHKEACSINKFYNLEKSVEYINTKIQELIDNNTKILEQLTNPDAVVKMMAQAQKNLPVEGISF